MFNCSPPSPPLPCTPAPLPPRPHAPLLLRPFLPQVLATLFSHIDFEAETEVYSDTQDVSVPAGGSQVVELRLDTASVSGGDYLFIAVVESNGGQEEAFAEYLRVRLYIYLPLILRNH